MSRRRKQYTGPNIIPTKGTRVVLTRELHPEIVPRHSEVIKFIASLQISGIDVLPKSDTSQVTLLQSDTIRRYFMQRTNDSSVIDKDDLLDLEYQLNKVLGAEAPDATVQDDFGPLRVDEHDRLVIDLKETNELQIDRCRILAGLSEVLQLRKFSPKDIDDLLDPVAPVIPIATLDRRMLGKDIDDLAYDPVQYFYEVAAERLEVSTLPIDTFIPTALPLGNLSVKTVIVQPTMHSNLVEHFPDIAFDGVKKVTTHEMEYS